MKTYPLEEPADFRIPETTETTETTETNDAHISVLSHNGSQS